MKIRQITLLLILFSSQLFAQDSQRDKGTFKEYKKGYYQNTILKGIKDYKDSTTAVKRMYFSADLSGLSLPSSPEEFTKYWHNTTVSQGNTGTCWSFATTSFFDSEIFRITGKKVRLSVMYIVYWEYIERAKYFVKYKGDCYLGEGSEANALPRLMSQYGAMPDSVYNGFLKGQTVYDHSALFEEYEDYLTKVKSSGIWNDSAVVDNVKAILNKYMGEPPTKFDFRGKKYSPQTFLTDYCQLVPRDYFSFMSDNKTAFNQKAELVENDNWWHSNDYYNVSADDFVSAVIGAIKAGYTISICGDVSEPGIDKEKQVAVVPTFDIPSAYINDDARQARFANGTTTDDHCLHLVGYLIKDKKYWFLTKDTGAGAFDGKYQGYKYLNEDYVKLKMMNILLYKYAAREILDKIIK